MSKICFSFIPVKDKTIKGINNIATKITISICRGYYK